jgi:hypothetical protein
MVVDSFRSATASLEPYVDSIVAGKFLELHPVTVMRLAGRAIFPDILSGTRREGNGASYSRHSVAGSHGGPVPRKNRPSGKRIAQIPNRELTQATRAPARQTRQVRPSPDLQWGSAR